jgi:hypothetical protein
MKTLSPFWLIVLIIVALVPPACSKRGQPRLDFEKRVEAAQRKARSAAKTFLEERGQVNMIKYIEQGISEVCTPGGSPAQQLMHHGRIPALLGACPSMARAYVASASLASTGLTLGYAPGKFFMCVMLSAIALRITIVTATAVVMALTPLLLCCGRPRMAPPHGTPIPLSLLPLSQSLIVPVDIEVFLIGFDGDGGYAYK